MADISKIKTLDGQTHNIKDANGRGYEFVATLSASSWSNGAQTVSNANFVANGYSYIVQPDPASRSAYIASDVYADNVTSNGNMTFHCGDTPSVNLTINILRIAG